MKAEEYELALEAFQTCLNWRQAVCVACKLQLPKDRMYSIARSMAGERLAQNVAKLCKNLYKNILSSIYQYTIKRLMPFTFSICFRCSEIEKTAPRSISSP